MIGELSSLNKLNRVASVERLGLTLTISEILAADGFDQVQKRVYRAVYVLASGVKLVQVMTELGYAGCTVVSPSPQDPHWNNHVCLVVNPE
jgi:hypothetical protein